MAASWRQWRHSGTTIIARCPTARRPSATHNPSHDPSIFSSYHSSHYPPTEQSVPKRPVPPPVPPARPTARSQGHQLSEPHAERLLGVAQFVQFNELDALVAEGQSFPYVGLVMSGSILIEKLNLEVRAQRSGGDPARQFPFGLPQRLNLSTSLPPPQPSTPRARSSLPIHSWDADSAALRTPRSCAAARLGVRCPKGGSLEGTPSLVSTSSPQARG